MAACSHFNPGQWKPNQCRNCFQGKAEHTTSQDALSVVDVSVHSNVTHVSDTTAKSRKPIEKTSSANSATISRSDDYLPSNIKESQAKNFSYSAARGAIAKDDVSFFNLADTNQTMSLQPSLQPCMYGMRCYRKNPDHFKMYSHPPDHPSRQISMSQPAPTERPLGPSHLDPHAKKIAELENELKAQKAAAEIHLEMVEKRFLDSIADLQNKNKYCEQEIENLRQEKTKMARYHQGLENALAEELNNRERREIEKKRILEIKRDTPSYWGANALVEPCREIPIQPGSPEFNIINGLLNDTIEAHTNQHGTIYGKDPSEFIITKLTRIQNRKLWHEYCFKKESIIDKNNHRLTESESSRYLQEHSVLTPLLDASANEYWLFHGCDHRILPIMLNEGYDPRMSSLEGMFGGGFYLAENSSKSNQYIPCPGCGENAIFKKIGCKCRNQENLEFSMILYRTVLGDVHVAKVYDQKTYREGEASRRIRRPPCKKGSSELCDSVMGESKKYGGNQLQYREFILYEPSQAYPEYVIQFKRSAANARPPSDIKRVKERCYYFLKNTFNTKGQ